MNELVVFLSGSRYLSRRALFLLGANAVLNIRNTLSSFETSEGGALIILSGICMQSMPSLTKRMPLMRPLWVVQNLELFLMPEKEKRA